jgi:cell division protease FtsH
MNARLLRNGFIWFLLIVAAVVVLTTLLQPDHGNKEVPISTVMEWAKQGRVASIEVRRNDLTVTTQEGQTFRSRKEEGFSLVEALAREGVVIGEGGVKVTVKGGGGLGNIFGIALNFLPLLLLVFLLLFMLRQAQGAPSQTLNFGRSRARLFISNRPTVTFADVAGVDEAKQELQEVVEFLKYPERFAALGARIPKGLLLVGPPGTGKTLLARAVAGEAGVPFFSISGSEFVEMFVGVGAARVRDLFDQAKRNAPCIVFIDEIDAVGRHRGAGLGGGHDEREQTLNQILVEMDGFDSSTNVIIIAATNRPDILDPALLRPGRFDRRVVLDLPDVQGRLAILKVHTKGKPLESEVSLDLIARQTAGFSGADLANLVNEAAILAARRNKKSIGSQEFTEAIDRVVAGPERKSRVLSPKEKEITAYHEAGHALVARMLPHADPVHKISIVARGTMGGYTRLLPQEDRHLWTRSQFEAMLAVALGGRTAEEIVFGEVTTGASNDLEHATRLARAMVTRYGMSQRLGPRVYGKREELVFLGKEIAEQRDYSPRTEELIDEEVNALLSQAKGRAEAILRSHRAKLDQIARYLMQYETVEGEDLERLFNAPPDVEVQPRPPLTPAPSEGPKVSTPSAGSLPAPVIPAPQGPAPAPAS